jgi:hypothetical protein
MADDINVVERLTEANKVLNDEKNMEAWQKLMECQPFQYYEEKIAELEQQIVRLNETVNLLRRHTHNELGVPCVTF